MLGPKRFWPLPAVSLGCGFCACWSLAVGLAVGRAAGAGAEPGGGGGLNAACYFPHLIRKMK